MGSITGTYSIAEVISILMELVSLETSGRHACMVNQQSCDLQSMTIDGLNVVFVADSSSDLTDTRGSVFETFEANNHNKSVDRKEEFLVGEPNDPDMELALRLQREEDEHHRKQIEQDEELARELQHRDFSYRVPVNSLAPKKVRNFIVFLNECCTSLYIIGTWSSQSALLTLTS